MEFIAEVRLVRSWNPQRAECNFSRHDEQGYNGIPFHFF